MAGAASKLGQLFVQIGADVAPLLKDLKDVSKSSVQLGKELGSIGTALTLNLTVPLQGFQALALHSSLQATNAFKAFGERTEAVMGDLGDDLFKTLNLQGWLNLLEGTLRSAVGAFLGLSDAMKFVIIATAGLVSAIGPALVIMANWTLLTARLREAMVVLGDAINWLKANPITALVGAFAAIAAGFLVYNAVAKASTEETKIYGDALLEAKRRLDSAREALERFKRAGEGGFLATQIAATEARIVALTSDIREMERELKKGFAPANARAQLREWNDELKSSNILLEALKKKFTDKKAEKEEQVAIETVKTSTLSYAEALKRLQREQHLGGSESEFLRGKIKALNDEKQRLLDTPGTDDQLRQVILDLKLTTDEYDRLTAAQQRGRQELEKTHTAAEEFARLLLEIPPIGIQIGRALHDVTQSFIAGVGNAVASAIVYGQSLSKALLSVVKQVAAQIISTLIQIGIQQLILSVIGKAAAVATGTTQIGISAGRAGAAAVAASFEELGLAGFAVAVENGLSAIALATAAGSFGIEAGASTALSAAAAAKGGIFPSPDITKIAEREPEVVLTQRHLQEFAGLSGLGGGDLHVHVEVEGEEMAHVVLRNIPDVLRHQGVAV